RDTARSRWYGIEPSILYLRLISHPTKTPSARATARLGKGWSPAARSIRCFQVLSASRAGCCGRGGSAHVRDAGCSVLHGPSSRFLLIVSAPRLSRFCRWPPSVG